MVRHTHLIQRSLVQQLNHAQNTEAVNNTAKIIVSNSHHSKSLSQDPSLIKPCHPAHHLFQIMPSTWHNGSLPTKTSHFKKKKKKKVYPHCNED